MVETVVSGDSREKYLGSADLENNTVWGRTLENNVGGQIEVGRVLSGFHGNWLCAQNIMLN